MHARAGRRGANRSDAGIDWGRGGCSQKVASSEVCAICEVQSLCCFLSWWDHCIPSHLPRFRKIAASRTGSLQASSNLALIPMALHRVPSPGWLALLNGWVIDFHRSLPSIALP